MAAAAETSSYRLRADEARAEERAVLQDLAQARAQLTDALERQAHRSAAAARPASGTATAVSLEVDVAVRTEQLEAARTLLRKVTADVRSLEAECAQFETPHGAVGVRGRLSDAQLRELLRRSYEAPLAARKQAAKRIERELKSQAQLARGKPVPAARLDDMTKRLSLPVMWKLEMLQALKGQEAAEGAAKEAASASPTKFRPTAVTRSKAEESRLKRLIDHPVQKKKDQLAKLHEKHDSKPTPHVARPAPPQHSGVPLLSSSSAKAARRARPPPPWTPHPPDHQGPEQRDAGPASGGVAAGWAGGEPVSADAAAFAKAEAAARDDATDGSDADEGEEEMEGYEIEIPEGYTGGDIEIETDDGRRFLVSPPDSLPPGSTFAAHLPAAHSAAALARRAAAAARSHRRAQAAAAAESAAQAARAAAEAESRAARRRAAVRVQARARGRRAREQSRLRIANAAGLLQAAVRGWRQRRATAAAMLEVVAAAVAAEGEAREATGAAAEARSRAAGRAGAAVRLPRVPADPRFFFGGGGAGGGEVDLVVRWVAHALKQRHPSLPPSANPALPAPPLLSVSASSLFSPTSLPNGGGDSGALLLRLALSYKKTPAARAPPQGPASLVLKLASVATLAPEPPLLSLCAAGAAAAAARDAAAAEAAAAAKALREARNRLVAVERGGRPATAGRPAVEERLGKAEAEATAAAARAAEAAAAYRAVVADTGGRAEGLVRREHFYYAHPSLHASAVAATARAIADTAGGGGGTHDAPPTAGAASPTRAAAPSPSFGGSSLPPFRVMYADLEGPPTDIPAADFAAENKTTTGLRSVLLLTDLADFTPLGTNLDAGGREGGGMSGARAGVGGGAAAAAEGAAATEAARCLARLHATHWGWSVNGASLAPPPCYARLLFAPPGAGGGAALGPHTLAGFLDLWRGHPLFGAALAETAVMQALVGMQRAMGGWAPESAALHSSSATLLHGDPCTRNLLVKRDARGNADLRCPPAAVALVDYQHIGCGPPAWDLAYFLLDAAHLLTPSTQSAATARTPAPASPGAPSAAHTAHAAPPSPTPRPPTTHDRPAPAAHALFAPTVAAYHAELCLCLSAHSGIRSHACGDGAAHSRDGGVGIGSRGGGVLNGLETSSFAAPPSLAELSRRVDVALLTALAGRLSVRASSLTPDRHAQLMRRGGRVADALRTISRWELSLLRWTADAYARHAAPPPQGVGGGGDTGRAGRGCSGGGGNGPTSQPASGNTGEGAGGGPRLPPLFYCVDVEEAEVTLGLAPAPPPAPAPPALPAGYLTSPLKGVGLAISGARGDCGLGRLSAGGGGQCSYGGHTLAGEEEDVVAGGATAAEKEEARVRMAGERRAKREAAKRANEDRAAAEARAAQAARAEEEGEEEVQGAAEAGAAAQAREAHAVAEAQGAAGAGRAGSVAPFSHARSEAAASHAAGAAEAPPVAAAALTTDPAFSANSLDCAHAPGSNAAPRLAARAAAPAAVPFSAARPPSASLGPALPSGISAPRSDVHSTPPAAPTAHPPPPSPPAGPADHSILEESLDFDLSASFPSLSPSALKPPAAGLTAATARGAAGATVGRTGAASGAAPEPRQPAEHTRRPAVPAHDLLEESQDFDLPEG